MSRIREKIEDASDDWSDGAEMGECECCSRGTMGAVPAATVHVRPCVRPGGFDYRVCFPCFVRDPKLEIKA